MSAIVDWLSPNHFPGRLYSYLMDTVSRLWLRAQRSEHVAEGGVAGLGPVRLIAKKKAATIAYASHHRPRSGKYTVLHPVRATETRPLYQFFAAP